MRLDIPYNFTPREYQLPLLKALDDGIRRALIVWHRRSGKDKVCWNYMIKKAVAEKGAYFYFLPSYTQAKKVIWDNMDDAGFKMLEHIPPQITKKTREDELKIELTNGSIIQLIAADTFDKTSVGTNPRGVVLSEYSICSTKVWDFLRPILLVNQGWAIFNFTPRGMNHAWKLHQIIKDNENWFSEVLTIEDTNVLTRKDILEEMRSGMPEDLADQEYYCKYIEGATACFKRIDENVIDENLQLERGKRYQIGVDLAKYHDYTVLTVVDLHTFKVVKQMKLPHLDWKDQKEIIVREVRYWNRGRTYIDSTGVGDPIVEDLKRLLPSVEPFTFSSKTRPQLLQNLQIMFEQDKLKIPKEQELIDELKSMQYELVGKRVTMQVPEGLHDDRIMSLALACWGLSERLPYREESRLRKKASDFVQGIKVRMTNY